MLYPYNTIFGWGLLNTFEAALHSGYLYLKVPATIAIITVFDSQKKARNIERGFAPDHKNVYFLREDTKQHEQEHPSSKREISTEFKKAIKAECDFKRVALDPRVSDKTVCISTEMSPQEQAELLQFLDKNSNVFAWSTSDLVGVSWEVIEHKLQVNPHAKPKNQKLHKMSEEKIEAAKAYVQRLLDARFIREVRYSQWLANIVIVRKKNRKWWMCTNFTDCPKDDFPLTRIDKIIDFTAVCEIMALLDYFSFYHQIWPRKEDEEKTSFITSFGMYCYLRMSKGLRNIGSTFCIMMKAALKDQVSKNVLSYVDDIVVASKKKASYISNLTETFTNMHEAKLKLNPDKCVFRVTRDKVLSCLVSTKGIKASPDKIKAILQMEPPQTRKEVQKLTGHIAALNRFIAKLTERSLSFFSILRGPTKVEWGPK
jgi:hypothetical protein